MNKISIQLFFLALILIGAPFSSWSAERQAIGLHEAIVLALAKNPSLAIERMELKIAEQSVQEQKADFDPSLSYSLNKSRAKNPDTGQDVDFIRERDRTVIGVNGLLPTGTSYTVEYSQIDLLTSDAGNNSENLAGDFSIEIRHPLLNGVYSNESTFQRRVTNNRKNQQAYRVKEQIMDTVRNTASAYANLYLSARRVDIAKDSLARADRFLKDTKTRVDVGRIAPSDTTLAETRYARRLEALKTAESSLALAQSRLFLLISDPLANDLDLKQHSLHPKALPTLDAFSRNPIIDSEYAIANSYAYQTAELEVDLNSTFLKNEKQNALPDVDFRVGYTQLGVAEGQRFSRLQRSFREDDSNETYASLTISLPLGNRAAKSRISQRSYQKHIAELDKADLKRKIKTTILDAAIIAQNNWERISITKNALSLAEASLIAEEKKLNAGRSNSFFVLDLQEDVANEDNRHLRAQVDYFNAIVAYEHATLKLLERFNIKL